ncbi:Cysteine protease [Phytophthora megakarya]|uniref:Cysteine protease n=1 Tax=Phytophthora megakarya TaxID=4795 RepID=A0A225WW41_9STRA|nr:Cysteine protease [Phytophthora megakarya]
MYRWHTGMEYLDQTGEGINRAVHKHKAYLHTLQAFGWMCYQTTAASWCRSTPCGNVSYRALLTLRENVWIDDNCIAHGLALLQRVHKGVRNVNPIFSRFENKEEKLKDLNGDNPFEDKNKIVLLALHVGNNHWCGAVFDFRRDSRGITVFDTLQTAESKFYDECEELLNMSCEHSCISSGPQVRISEIHPVAALLFSPFWSAM